MLCKNQAIFFITYTHFVYPAKPPGDAGCFLSIIVEFGRPYSVFGVYERSTKAIFDGRSRANRNEDPAPGRVLSLSWRKL